MASIDDRQMAAQSKCLQRSELQSVQNGIFILSDTADVNYKQLVLKNNCAGAELPH